MIDIEELLKKIDVDKLIEDYGKEEPECLDFGGVPVNVGDVLYFAGEKCAFSYGTYRVVDIKEDDGLELELLNGARIHDYSDRYTHREPDSWERLEKDSKLDSTSYCEQVLNIDTYIATNGHIFRSMIDDIMLRAKRLAGVSDE